MSKWSETLAGVGTGILQAYEQDYQRKVALNDKMQFSAFEHDQRVALENHRHGLDMIAKEKAADREDVRAYNLSSMATERALEIQKMIGNRQNAAQREAIAQKDRERASQVAASRMDQMLTDVNRMLGLDVQVNDFQAMMFGTGATEKAARSVGTAVSKLKERLKGVSDPKEATRIQEIITEIQAWSDLVLSGAFSTVDDVRATFDTWDSFDLSDVAGEPQVQAQTTNPTGTDRFKVTVKY